VGLDTFVGRDREADEFGCTKRDLWALRRLQRKRERANGGHCLFHRGYFRGKLYVDLVQHLTGVDLYETWIAPETVEDVAEAFERLDPEETIRDFRAQGRPIYDHTAEDVADLAALFELCAVRGLGLVGSW
jgi:hypothetical protein